MKIWIDDVRPAPEGYHWVKSVNGAICEIERLEERNEKIDLLDLDHDAGGYYIYGGDYIKILDWLEETGRNYPIKIHSMNPVGRANMLAICERNSWEVIY